MLSGAAKKNIGVPFYWTIYGEKREVLKGISRSSERRCHEAEGEVWNWVTGYWHIQWPVSPL